MSRIGIRQWKWRYQKDGSSERILLPSTNRSLQTPALVVGFSGVAFPDANWVGIHGFLFITRLNPFTLSHCSPSSPCVRFADSVTDADATLSTRCLTRAFGAGIYLRLAGPSKARRTSNGTENRAKAESPSK